MSERFGSVVFVAAAGTALVAVVLLLVAFAPTTGADLQAATLWYVRRSWHHSSLLLPVVSLTAIALVGWALVARRERARFRSEVDHGAVPLRVVGVVEPEILAAKARSMLAPQLKGARPRIERLIDGLMAALVDLGASELSLTPERPGGTAVVTMLVGMDRVEVMRLPRPVYQSVLEQLRLMLAVERIGSGDIELRWGEDVEQIEVELAQSDHGFVTTLRLRRRCGFALRLAELGMPQDVLEGLTASLASRSGLVLINGPPGQGVTTTLYGCAHHIARAERPRRVIALEPRIHLELPFAYQAEVGHGSSARMLQRLLDHHAAETVIVRDMANPQTARLSLEAAERRLVLGTAGGIDAVSGIATMIRQSDGRLLSERLVGSLGQQLVRVICRRCRRPVAEIDERTEAWLAQLGLESGSLMSAAGCAACDGRGWSGRRPLFDFVENGAWLAPSIARGASLAELERAAGEQGVLRMAQRAAREAARGRISLDELARLAGSRGRDGR